MSTREDNLGARLHAAVDDHPAALMFDVESYVAAGRTQVRRRRAAAVLATVASIAVLAGVVVLASGGMRPEVLQPAGPAAPTIQALGPGANGWVAVDALNGGDIYLLRPGQDARPIQVAGSDTANDACPTWSPDGTRLMFGRLNVASQVPGHDAELVIVAIGPDGATGAPRAIPLDGFGALDGFEPHPCASWAPDGRWVALRGPGDVWVVDTQSSAVRRLSNLRPLDLEWRPGTDQLTISGDMGSNRAADWLATPVSVYSVSTNELRQLGSVKADEITWSPDGATLAYTGGGPSAPGLRLVDGNGQHDRMLVASPGTSLHGIGPVWSPTGDRIVYQRRCCGSGEGSEVVVVDVRDGTLKVIAPPTTGGPQNEGSSSWYPFFVTWSPDGTTLLYQAWAPAGDASGLLTVDADRPGDVEQLPVTLPPVPGYKDHRWVPNQMWGRQPG